MSQPYVRVLIAVFLALILMVVSLPEQLALVRPLWVLLLVLYVQVTLPSVFQVTGLLLLGLTLDALCTSVMGQHVLALILSSWCVSGRARRFKFFSMTQQMAWVLFLSVIYQLTLLLSNLVLGYPVGPWLMVLPVCMTTLIWPWVKFLADRSFFVFTR